MVGTATEYALAIDTLPVNGLLTLQGLSWNDYENLLKQMGEAPSLRVSYDEGKILSCSTRSKRNCEIEDCISNKLFFNISHENINKQTYYKL